MILVKKALLLVALLCNCCILCAQKELGGFVFAISNDGSLFTHNDTISLKEAGGIISIHALYLGKEKVSKLKIKEFQMTIIRDNEPDVSFKGSNEILTPEMKSFLKRKHPQEIIPVAFEGIFAENSEPGKYFGIRRGVSLLRLFVNNK